MRTFYLIYNKILKSYHGKDIYSTREKCRKVINKIIEGTDLTFDDFIIYSFKEPEDIFIIEKDNLVKLNKNTYKILNSNIEEV